MKFSKSSIAAALVARTMAQEFTPALNNTPPLDGTSLSLRGRNILERQTYDYCGLSSYYCIGAECCGISTIFNCMDPGGECCASLSTYGYGLWCSSGTTCVVRSGLVQCQNSNGVATSIVSSGPSKVRTTSTSDYTTTTYGDSTTTSRSRVTTAPGSEETDFTISTKKSKSKSKAWIAGAVVGPLLGIAIIAGVVFFLFVLKKKKKTDANIYANSAILSTNQPGGPPPPMASAQAPPPAPAPLSPNPDYKSPAYTQHYDVPTPIASPPPQWTPASPVPSAVSPAPVYAQHQFTNELHGQSAPNAISPMNTGNGGYGAPIHQPQPVYGGGEGLLSGGAQVPSTVTTAELPTAPAAQVPRGGAQELHG